MKNNILSLIWISFICINFSALFLINNISYANTVNGMSLHAPEKVAKGDAFIVNFESTSIVKAINFLWNEQEFTIPTTLIDNVYTANFLLPVSLLNENSSQTLIIEPLQEQWGNIVHMPALSKEIFFYEKDRPVEKLKVDKKYVDPPKEVLERIKRDRAKIKDVRAIFQPVKNWTLPLYRSVPGSISSLFGLKRVYNDVPKSYHRALDLRGAAGTPIRAVADGRVILAESLYYSGNVIFLDHGYGVISTYSHMSKFKSEYGQRVQRGEIIGYVGSTGLSTGPHLHLGLLVLGVAVDPLPFLEKKKKIKGK